MALRPDKAAERLRRAEVRMAEKLAKAEAEKAKRLAKAEAGKAKGPSKAGARGAKEFWRDQPIRRGIRIDLLAEAREEKERRRKDPVRRAAWMACFCVSVMLLWTFKLQVDINFSRSEFRSLDRRFAAIRGKGGTAANHLIKSIELDQKLAALDRLTINRFLWAPLLNALQKVMVDDIQVIRLAGEQKITREDPHTISTGSLKTVIPGGVVERISLYLEAKDISSNEVTYLKYKASLSSCDYFAENLKSRDGFILEDILKPPAHGPSDPSNQFTMFVLSAHFPELRRGQ